MCVAGDEREAMLLGERGDPDIVVGYPPALGLHARLDRAKDGGRTQIARNDRDGLYEGVELYQVLQSSGGLFRTVEESPTTITGSSRRFAELICASTAGSAFRMATTIFVSS